MLTALVACGGGDEPEEQPNDDPCTEHVDENGDYACDKCGELTLPADEDDEVTVGFTVKDNEGNTLSDITVILTPMKEGENSSYSAVSGEDGTLELTLPVGDYFVIYDYDIDAVGYYLTDTSEVTVAKNTEALELYLINNNPDGTPEKPFSLSAGENAVIIPADTAYNYIVYRAVDLFVTVECDGAKVIYRDNEYLPEDGVIIFDLLGEDTNSTESFAVENVSGGELTVKITVNSLPGTSGNPYAIEELGVEITKSDITSEDIIYYSYVAEKSGMLALSIISENSRVSMLNTSNSIAASTASEEATVIHLEVMEGVEIIIDISTSLLEGATVTFVLDYVDEAVD